MEQSKSLGGDQRLRPSTLIQDRREQGEEQGVLRGESDGLSSPIPLQDVSTRDDADAKNDFWSIKGDFIYRHHVEPRVKLYVPRKESFLIPLQYIDVTRNTNTSLDAQLEKNIVDYWNVDGIRCMDGLHKSHFIERKASWRIYMVWGETYEETNDLKTRQCMARYVEAYVWCAKHKWIIEKPKLDNARQLRGIFFIEPDDDEFKHTMRNARRKWEIPMPVAMLCRTPANCRGEICRRIGKTRPNMLVLSMPTNLWEYDWKVYHEGIM